MLFEGGTVLMVPLVDATTACCALQALRRTAFDALLTPEVENPPRPNARLTSRHVT